MADAQLAAVKALAAQAGSGPAARQALIASGAVPKLAKHLSSKTGAISSQSALALSLLASDPETRPSVWEQQRALVPALVQALKTGGPLTLARSLATLAELIKHIPIAGPAVVKAHGVVPILRIAQAGSEGPRDAAITALNAFHVKPVRRMPKPADEHTWAAFQRSGDLVEPLIRALSDGPDGVKLFALSVLRWLPEEPKVLQALRRPAVTDLLVGFAAAEDVDIAATSLEVLADSFGSRNFPDEIPPEDAAYRASPTLRKLCEILPSCLQSSETALVKAASAYVSNCVRTPVLAEGPWMQECVRNVPLLLQSPADVVKVQGMHLALHAWVVGMTSDTELSDGPVLPLVIGLLDLRPQARPCGAFPDLRYCFEGVAADPAASRIASRTYAAALAHAGDPPLPPMPIFDSCAKVAERAGGVLRTISTQAWGFEALAPRGFHTLAAALLKEKLLPLGAVAALESLFYYNTSENSQRLALAMQFLAADYVGYLFEWIQDGEPKILEIARRSVLRVTESISFKYAYEPNFPTEKVMRALLCGIRGQTLLRAETYSALWPPVYSAVQASLAATSGIETFQNVGGVEWATNLIRQGPMHAKVGALHVLFAAETSAQRNRGHILWSPDALGVIVGAALSPPSEVRSQEAMALCVRMTDRPSGHDIRGDIGAATPRVPASASHTSPQSEGSGIGRSGDSGNEGGSEALRARAELAQSASAAAGPAGGNPNHRSPPAEASEGSGVVALGNGGKTEAGSETEDAPADMAPVIPAELAPDVPAAPGVNADLASDIPADQPREVFTDLVANLSAEMGLGTLAEMAQLGAVRAAIAHLKIVSAPPAPGANSGSPRLTCKGIAQFLSRICAEEGAFPDLRDNGGLQLLVDLMRHGEEHERKLAGRAVVSLAVSVPVACAALQSLHAVTPLVLQLEDSSGADSSLSWFAVNALVRDGDGNGRQPAPGAVEDLLAAGAVLLLLHILASQSENATRAFELLRLIACEPCGLAAIVAADCARPLVDALALPSQPRLSDQGDVETPGIRADVISMITRIVEERPEQGQALFAARLAARLTPLLQSQLVNVERKLAMELVEKLICHVPGACDVLMGAGTLLEVHKLAIAPPTSTDPGCAADISSSTEEQDPLAHRTPEGVSEAEAAQARELLCRIAGYCGGKLEFAGMDSEPIRYTSESDTRQSQRTTHPPEMPDGARVQRSAKRVCSLCGVVSEKDLRKCSGCMRARYCSKECQKAHWPVHKGECRV